MEEEYTKGISKKLQNHVGNEMNIDTDTDTYFHALLAYCSEVDNHSKNQCPRRCTKKKD